MTETQRTDDEASASSLKTDSKLKAAKAGRFGRFFVGKKTPTEAERLLNQHQAKADLDKKLVLKVNGKKEGKIPSWPQLQQLKRFLSPKEDLVLRTALLFLAVAIIFLATNFWFFTLQLVPDYGGEYSEGLVGSPKYINPVLAPANDVDLDIASMIFCGLMKRGDGGLEPVLAKEYSISDDQKEYTFVLKPDIKWHDGKEVTVDDVLFTFDLIKDAEVGSPLLVSFKGISAEKIDEQTFKFILKEPFTPFLSTLTFGILPEHLWTGIDPANIKLAELNLKPVGCGPFKFDSLKKDKQGNIKSFTLTANEDYFSGRPYLDKIVFKFYPDLVSLEQAVVNKNVLAASYLPRDSRNNIFGDESEGKGFSLYALNLPQYSAVFFNQNNNGILKNKAVRQALYQAIDRQRIVGQALGGEAEVIHGPILPGFIGYYPEIAKYSYSPAAATALLDGAGWQAVTPNDYITWQREQDKKSLAEGEEFVDRSDEERLAEIADQEYFRKKDGTGMEIVLTTVDQPENVAVAEIIQENWQEIGVRTRVDIIPPEEIMRQAIKPRAYEALLYSEIIGYDPDPYSFWHSSQNTDPGLNLAIFTDKRVDKYIETARQTNDCSVREENYKNFQDILAAEVPAIFLYSPTYSYIVNSKVNGLTVQRIFTPADRLSDLSRRYIVSRRTWPAN